ncbi:MAG: hypothetical protein A2017_16785 [Lentisphaerae bacterium GWF2_44_16]|nr:MAG: hypothetical protein A2017_16785 [Lentisphaerae bacterium GWF2_44_16]
MQQNPENTSIMSRIDPDKIAADSHVGLVRMLNEDCFAYYTGNDCPASFALLADGIGGHESGNIASTLCTRIVLNSWRNSQFSENSTEKELSDFLSSEIIKANSIIYNLNNMYQIQHPMGTTVVASIFFKDKVIVAHAGDSRFYRLRSGKLEQLTDDHSFVAELVRKNIIKPEEAPYHPFAHIISKSVGPVLEMAPEVNTFERQPGDRYLLCTDGLTNHVEDNTIQGMMSESATPYESVHRLLNSSLRGGGEDNITIICVWN